MFSLVEKYHERKLSKAAFCKKHKVQPWVLAYWCRKFKEDNQESHSGFIQAPPIRAKKEQANATFTYIIRFSNGHALELDSSVPLDILQTLIRTQI